MRVLVVDDHAIVREGMKQVLAEEPNLVVGEASTAREALRRVRAEHWDVVVLDISLPDRSGLDILGEIKAHDPALRVLVLTVFGEEIYAVRVLKAGADGFLTKESVPEELRNPRKDSFSAPFFALLGTGTWVLFGLPGLLLGLIAALPRSRPILSVRRYALVGVGLSLLGLLVPVVLWWVTFGGPKG